MNEYAATLTLVVLMIVGIMAGLGSRIDSKLLQLNNATLGKYQPTTGTIEANR